MESNVARIVTKPNKETIKVRMRPSTLKDTKFIDPVMKYLSDKRSEHEVKERIQFLLGWRKLSYDNKVSFLRKNGYELTNRNWFEVREMISDIDKMSFQVKNFVDQLKNLGIEI